MDVDEASRRRGRSGCHKVRARKEERKGEGRGKEVDKGFMNAGRPWQEREERASDLSAVASAFII